MASGSENEEAIDALQDEGQQQTAPAANQLPKGVTQKEFDMHAILMKREASHLKQWRKHLLALLSIAIALIVNFLRGSKKMSSIIDGFERCSPTDWSIFVIFIVIQAGLTFLGVVINRRE